MAFIFNKLYCCNIQILARLFYVLVFITTHLTLNSQPYEIPTQTKRIVILGNSISYQGAYIELLDLHYSIKKSDFNFEWINVALPSETVSKLSEPNHANGKFPRPYLQNRLDRILEKTKPDLVLSCYGMNDGIYLPFDEDRFTSYKDGILWLHKQVTNWGSHIIHITPPVYDEKQDPAYANVMDIYSTWLISKRYTDSWNVIDIHWPMKKTLENKRIIDSTFVFAEDGVHPNEAGHLLMAQQILLSLGEDIIDTDAVDDYIARYPNGLEIMSKIRQQHRMSKDAWLTHIGHERPSMREGIPLDSMNVIFQALEADIQRIMHND